MTLKTIGWSRVDQNRDLLINGGHYEMHLPEPAARGIASTRSTLGIEVVFRLFTGSTAIAEPNVLADLSELLESGQVFRLALEDRALILEIGQAPAQRYPIARFTDDLFHHLSIGYRGGSVSVLIDGQPSPAILGPTHVQFSGKGKLIGGGQWRGVLAGLRLTDQASQIEQVAEDLNHFRTEVIKRPVISRRTVRVMPLKRAQVPQPASILPYRSALVVDTYRIERGNQDLTSGSVCHVAHFRIIDGKPVPLPQAHNPQGELELTLEPLSGHPELESVFLVDPTDRPANELIWVEADR